MEPKAFWIGVAALYALGALSAGIKCFQDGWDLKNMAQLWLMAGSAITNLLFGFVLDK